jgi:hypothetical protein
MKKHFLPFLLVVLFLLIMPRVYAQDIGSILCWQYQEIYGGHDYPHNRSIVTRNLPSTTNPKWEGMVQWWENIVEEVDYSGLDYVALLSRGTQPNRSKDLGSGDPKHINTLVKYMKDREAKFKLCIFDDPPASWRQSRNYDLYDKDFSKYELFDCANTDNYKYIWDYNLKLAIEYIPEEMRYTIDNRLVIFFWQVSASWMTNIDGNLSKILTYIKEECQKTYGFVPYIIVQRAWLERDKSLTASDVDAVHNWFSAAGGTSYTLHTHNQVKVGVAVPSFVKPSEPNNGVLLPAMGTSDQGMRLKFGLNNTVKAGARVTLLEGFTNAAEGAAFWRSGDKLYYDYPNQRLNIIRSYTQNPFPDTLRVEAEACDVHHDLTTGNSGGAFLHEGNLDVRKCSDKLGGWFVSHTQANEWMEWKELPLLKNTKFQLRYKSIGPSSVQFSVNEAGLQTIALPPTGGVWTTIDAGTFSAEFNSPQTVRLTVVSGTPDINYFLRIPNDITSIGNQHLRNELNNSVHVYPNPYRQGNLSINLTGFEGKNNVQLKITNLLGQVVYQQELESVSNTSIDLFGKLNEAVYIVSVESGNEKVFTRLIVR